jgi:hypothetical protein
MLDSGQCINRLPPADAHDRGGILAIAQQSLSRAHTQRMGVDPVPENSNCEWSKIPVAEQAYIDNLLRFISIGIPECWTPQKRSHCREASYTSEMIIRKSSFLPGCNTRMPGFL